MTTRISDENNCGIKGINRIDSAYGPTITAIQHHKWTVVLLSPGTKQPLGTWDRSTTRNPTRIQKHLSQGGGIGLDTFASGVVVLDFDRPSLDMVRVLGPIPLTATSPSGGTHSYFNAVPNLPAKIDFDGKRIGEIIRGPHQQVVMPPSPYPGNSRGTPAGGFYTWLINPIDPLPDLPPAWREYLITPIQSIPDFIPQNDRRGIPTWDDWDGPPPEEIIRRAMLFFRGASRRKTGVKGQCPQCSADGHDRHRDNAFIRNDGVWGCAFAPGDKNHRRAIAKSLGIM